ncbi:MULTISPECIES: ATP-binding protein [unclassified Flavobacterium]|uniref:ATP-binding protein n=1 Tax=unclassified Flavobacterium TaxID=196869 RepID=UPI0013D2A60B|nr:MULTISPECIES: ATP-binding protein [unclassified Flavobacterium]MBA5792389.1 response regulator [Flavobacterium sp. xlx-221]
MTTEQNLKIKLTLGYILLILIFSFSILYILREVKNLNISKDDIVIENTKVIQLGTIMTDLYATENSGRMALLSYNKKDAENYHNQLDSLVYKIEWLKNNNIQRESVKLKLDTIVQIIKLKSLTFDQVLDVQAQYTNFDIYTQAKSQIQAIHNEADPQTVKIDTVVEKTNWWGRFKESFKNKDDENKEQIVNQNNKIIQQQLENQKNAQEKISKATENILSKAKNTEVKLLRNYYKKEEQLIERNKELSYKLRNILADVERSILENSANKYKISKGVIDNVSNNIAKIGIVISIVALFFGVIILRDLNKSARNKKKLEELNKKTKELAQQKSFFMATIAHDMVSPINSLMGFAALLKNTLQTPKQKDYLKDMVQSTRYIKNMVDDLSLFSNLEYNKIKIKESTFNFKDLVENVISNLKSTAVRKKIELKCTIDPLLNQNFTSDAYRVQQILTNVVSNAVKFTHKGSVTIDAKLINDVAEITVIDTGIGIKINKKEDLFNPFVQAHDTKENNYGGSGLGLNISKRLISLLNGKIWFDSEPQKGTVFHIHIPLKVYVENDANGISSEVEYDNQRKLQNKKILVVDDDPLQLKLLEEIFSSKVEKITTVENGKIVKDLLQKDTYDLIITDMQMPFYSGVKVIQDIRSLKEYANTPVIALTGKIDFDENEYKKLGFSFYMKKPLNINTLYNTIYKMLRIKSKPTVTAKPNTTKMQYKTNLFDLTELATLLEDDKEAMKQIIDSFIDNITTDLEKIAAANNNNNMEEVKNTAHKMLPMCKQLQINTVTPHLLKLEREIDTLTPKDISSEIEVVKEKMSEVIKKISEIT